MIDIERRDISVSYGNTLAIDFILHREDDSRFGPADRVLFKIRKPSGAVVLRRVYSLADDTFTFTLTNTESEEIPPGSYKYDFTVYTNAVLDDDGFPINGDEVATPFYAPALFQVKEIVSHE